MNTTPRCSAAPTSSRSSPPGRRAAGAGNDLPRRRRRLARGAPRRDARGGRRVGLGQVDDRSTRRPTDGCHQRHARVRGRRRDPRGGGGLREFRGAVQVIFQDPYSSLNPQHTVERIVTAPLVYQGRKIPGGARAFTRELMERVGLNPDALRALPGAVLRRSGAAHRHRPSARRLPQARHLRRGRVGPRRVGAGAGHQPAARPAVRGGLRLPLHRARPRRGAADRDQRRGDVAGSIVETGMRDAIFERPQHEYTKTLLAAVPRIDPEWEPPSRAAQAAQQRTCRGPGGTDHRTPPTCSPASACASTHVGAARLARPDGETIELFVRELVDPTARRRRPPAADLPAGRTRRRRTRGRSRRDGWIGEALRDYRVVLLDQRGTGRSTPVDRHAVVARGDGGRATTSRCFRADSIVRDVEHLRTTVYDGRRWATLGAELRRLAHPDLPVVRPRGPAAVLRVRRPRRHPPPTPRGVPPHLRARRGKTAEFDRRFPRTIDRVARIADRLADGDVRLPDGDRLTVRRFQCLGIDFGMKPGFERMHWLVDEAFVAHRTSCPTRSCRTSMTLSSQRRQPAVLDAAGIDLRRRRQRARPRGRPRPSATGAREFDDDRRPLLFTGEMVFPWMFDEMRLLRGFRAGGRRARRQDRLVAALRPRPRSPPTRCRSPRPSTSTTCTSTRGCSWRRSSASAPAAAWVTNEYEHDGIGDAAAR